MNTHDRSGWGAIFSVLVAVLVAFVPLIWKMQQAGESQKALEESRRSGVAIQKARQQQFEQQRQQPARRHDRELHDDQHKRDPRHSTMPEIEKLMVK